MRSSSSHPELQATALPKRSLKTGEKQVSMQLNTRFLLPYDTDTTPESKPRDGIQRTPYPKEESPSFPTADILQQDTKSKVAEELLMLARKKEGLQQGRLVNSSLTSSSSTGATTTLGNKAPSGILQEQEDESRTRIKGSATCSSSSPEQGNQSEAHNVDPEEDQAGGPGQADKTQRVGPTLHGSNDPDQNSRTNASGNEATTGAVPVPPPGVVIDREHEEVEDYSEQVLTSGVVGTILSKQEQEPSWIPFFSPPLRSRRMRGRTMRTRSDDSSEMSSSKENNEDGGGGVFSSSTTLHKGSTGSGRGAQPSSRGAGQDHGAHNEVEDDDHHTEQDVGSTGIQLQNNKAANCSASVLLSDINRVVENKNPRLDDGDETAWLSPDSLRRLRGDPSNSMSNHRPAATKSERSFKSERSLKGSEKSFKSERSTKFSERSAGKYSTGEERSAGKVSSANWDADLDPMFPFSERKDTNEILHPGLAMLLREEQTQEDLKEKERVRKEQVLQGGEDDSGATMFEDYDEEVDDSLLSMDGEGTPLPHLYGRRKNTSMDGEKAKSRSMSTSMSTSTSTYTFVTSKVLNEVNSKGQTALTYVGEEEIGLRILRHRTDLEPKTVNATDIYGWNVLNHACWRRMRHLVLELLKRRDLEKSLFQSRRNLKHHSALDYAKRNGPTWQPVVHAIENYISEKGWTRSSVAGGTSKG
ncbi:unnamed protein product [Amoebophrya sp. A25]|nr:unnamed protein product [Amoebophrya sp. A25]|eukprot:GSA25T00006407001.1